MIAETHIAKEYLVKSLEQNPPTQQEAIPLIFAIIIPMIIILIPEIMRWIQMITYEQATKLYTKVILKRIDKTIRNACNEGRAEVTIPIAYDKLFPSVTSKLYEQGFYLCKTENGYLQIAWC